METNLSSQQKKQLPWLKLLGYGLQLFIVTMLLLLIMSMVTGSESSEYPPAKFLWTSIVMAILLGGVSLLFSLRLKPATKKIAASYGIVWAVIIAAILLIIAIPNGTAGTIFGHWSTYLIFIGVAVGPVLKIPKTMSEPN